MLGRIFEAFSGKKDVPVVSKQERVESATCVLLLEVAGADDEFSPEECDHIIKSLCSRFSLSQQQAEELIVNNGGSVASSVSRRTSFLLLGENPGSKAAKAAALGIPAMSEEELLAQADVH